MSYKSLLKSNNAGSEFPVFGQKVFIRRLTSTELSEYSDAVDAERAGDNNETKLNILGVNLFLSALVNADGTKPKAAELPTAVELLKVHAPADLLEAIILVQKHSYGTLEAATKN